MEETNIDVLPSKHQVLGKYFRHVINNKLYNNTVKYLDISTLIMFVEKDMRKGYQQGTYSNAYAFKFKPAVIVHSSTLVIKLLAEVQSCFKMLTL